jgi:hypothetical protein
MKTYNIQYRQRQEGSLQLYICPVRALNLEEAKQLVMSKEGLKPSQMLKDEAMI